MKTIAFFLALASVASADEYTPVDWIQVTEDGGVAVTFETPVIWGDEPPTFWRYGSEIEIGTGEGCGKVYNTCRVGTVLSAGESCGFAGSTARFVLIVEEDGTACLYAGAQTCSSGGIFFYDFSLVRNDEGDMSIELLPGEPLNNVSIKESKWQTHSESEWIDISGTEREDGIICGADLSNLTGTFRWVADIGIEDITEKYASGNTVGEVLTAVMNITWGFLKSR